MTILFVTLQATFSTTFGQEKPDKRPASKLEYRKWSGDINVPDPVSISFDERGRAFVTQTARRKIQDLDIRQNQDWIPNDLSFRSVQDKMDFYHARLATAEQGGDSQRNKAHVEDVNKDGSHDYRDLMMVSEKIHLLEDTDADGTADKIGLFAGGFQSEVTGIAAGVLAHDGDVYATIAPDVWKLRDTDDDGKVDDREVMATGFGLHIAYAGHDMHGLTVGPDGRIYWSVGDKGINAISKEGNTKGKRYQFPNQGGVMRCNPDGSGFEIFAHGLRNVQELAFDQYGNLFGVDNDSDQPEERERFVWIVEGMDAGWRCNYQYRGSDYNPWIAERMWEPLNADQPAFIVPTIANSINGPCGFAFNPGTALSPDYKDYFFLTGTIQGEQLAFKIQPDSGSDSFKMTNVHTIGAGTPLIGINFSPGGGLFAVDWGGGYPLNDKGAVWEIDVPKFKTSELRLETSQLLASNFREKKDDLLMELLGHADQRVRLKAQNEIVRKNGFSTLWAVASKGKSTTARLHGIWGLGQLFRNGNETSVFVQLLNSLLDSEDEAVQIQAAKTIGEIPNADGEPLIPLLGHSQLQVRIHAALAIGRLGTEAAYGDLVQLAAATDPKHTYMRHAISAGLAGIGEKRLVPKLRAVRPGSMVHAIDLAQLSKHENEQVRLIAAIALRKLSIEYGNDARVSLGLGAFLKDAKPLVSTEAARAIYDDFSIGNSLYSLADILGKSKNVSQAFLRRAIGANFRMGGAIELARVAKFAADEENGLAMRLEALDAIADWRTPDVLDRVTGRYRGRKPMTQPVGLADSAERPVKLRACRSELIGLLDSELPEIQTASLMALRSLQVKLPSDRLIQILHSNLAVGLRVEALNSLASQLNGQKNDSKTTAENKDLTDDNKDLLLAQLNLAFDSTEPELKRSALGLLATVDPANVTERIKRLVWSEAYREKQSELEPGDLRLMQSALELLGEIGTPASDQLLSDGMDSLLRKLDELSPSLMLEVLESAGKRAGQNERLKSQLDEFESSRDDTDIGKFIECSIGGDSERGERTFNTHIEAQCVRCHRIGKKGSTVGPNLKGVASREPTLNDSSHLLRSIVAPSAHIEPKYQTMMFLLESGKSVQGVIVREDDKTIVLADAAGEETVVYVDEIEEEKKQELSIMPEVKTLTKREIRDLVAFLKSLKK